MRRVRDPLRLQPTVIREFSAAFRKIPKLVLFGTFLAKLASAANLF